jgi:putative membrane protein
VTDDAPAAPADRPPRSATAWSLVRGALVGGAEALPGISGGTVALVTGVYETAVTGAGHTLTAARLAVTDRTRARAELARVRWSVIVPLLIGMVPGLLVTVRFLAPMLEEHPVPLYGLFLGMTAAALVVPVRMAGARWSAGEVARALVVAAVVFVLVGLPPQHLTPTYPVVLAAAAVAACALALPGTSGSFLLLTFGLYQPTLAAVNDRDWGYVAVFLAGMVLGLACFVKALQWLLEHRRRSALVLLSGVMAGALRALWPWQEDDRTLLAPGDQVGLAAAAFVLGAAVVLGLVVAERRSRRLPDAG